MSKKEIVEKVKKLILDAEEAGSYENIDKPLCKKRSEWLNEHADDVDEKSVVKKAYLLLFKKLEIDLREVPVVHEDNKKIAWRSTNWCPVLEACKELGVDTRKVCKMGYENSVTMFVKKIDPRLTFSRDYKNLRPHGSCCEETIRLID